VASSATHLPPSCDAHPVRPQQTPNMPNTRVPTATEFVHKQVNTPTGALAFPRFAGRPPPPIQDEKTATVRLVGGKTRAEGFVEFLYSCPYKNAQGLCSVGYLVCGNYQRFNSTWVPLTVSSSNVSTLERARAAAVACRQLGYNVGTAVDMPVSKSSSSQEVMQIADCSQATTIQSCLCLCGR